jgi:CubicO group peptidase (beta-lactamase class C family)
LPQRLQAFCEAWHREAGGACTVVVARNGIVVFHAAFGDHAGQPATHDTAYPLFSLTKTVTGLMLSQFLDQGLLELDAPLGRVLPDLPVEGSNVITLRKCMMHVTGLTGHGNWKGLDNPWLDNVIANGIATVRPAYRYSGVAYDLAGMAMALVAGKSVPRLFDEHLFEPLEMRNASITGLGTGADLRAVDLARLGQVILNGGAYGNHTFFSPQTLEQFLPQPYEVLFPGFAPKERDYGLGIRAASEPHPRAGTDGIAPDAVVLGPRTVGHGAFSGSIFRVDLDTNTIVAAGRFSSGENHGRYLRELLALVADAVLLPPR